MRRGNAKDSKTRFTDRVDDYRKYRPGYPASVISSLKKKIPVRPGWIIADIGSGTGISSRYLASGFGSPVFAVEPNAAMRRAAEEDAHGNPFFRSVDGAAEATGLPDRSVDLVCAFQAFHWFDLARTRTECLRILRKPGWALVAWNDRMSDARGFSTEYERLLHSFPAYRTSTHRRISRKDFEGFFGTRRIERITVPNKQSLDWNGVLGRLASTSYSPKQGTPEFAKARERLKELFDRYSVRSRIMFRYRTIVYLARIV